VSVEIAPTQDEALLLLGNTDSMKALWKVLSVMLNPPFSNVMSGGQEAVALELVQLPSAPMGPAGSASGTVAGIPIVAVSF